MFGANFAQSGLGALAFALVVSLVLVFVLFAVLNWFAKRKGL